MSERNNFMIRSLYNWVVSLAQSRWSIWALAIISFAESSVFPIPPDILMIPMILARPNRAFFIAFVATISSVLGGAFGYWIGHTLFEQIGMPVLEFYGKSNYFETFKDTYNAWGAWAVLVAGLTPFPYKVSTILSGSTGLNLSIFMISSLIARGLRFYIVAALLWKFGPSIRYFIEKYLGTVFILLILLFLVGFFALRYL